MNQPDIKISVIPSREHHRDDNYNPIFLYVHYLTEIRNSGNSPATNLNLFLKFPTLHSIPVIDVESTENITENDLVTNTTKITGYLKTWNWWRNFSKFDF